MKQVTKKLDTLPKKPGIYLFFDKNKKVLYVGKAKNLRKRVPSYFKNSSNLAVDKKIMLAQIRDLRTIITDTETEALLLESNLIKKYRPRYNVLMKDDKSYQFIKIDHGDDFPKIYTVRKITDTKSHYFGPFTDAAALKRTLKLMRSLFPYRDCNLEINASDRYRKRACLKYYIKKCLGPCIGKISPEEYNYLIKQCELFLKGQIKAIIANLKTNMEQASLSQEYEKASEFRDQLEALQKITSEQKIVSTKQVNEDYLSIYEPRSKTKVQESIVSLIVVREGKIIGQENFVFSSPHKTPQQEIVSAFILDHYQKTTSLPQKIITPILPTFPLTHLRRILEKHFPKKEIQHLGFEVPKIGRKKKIIELGRKNAKKFYQELQDEALDQQTILEDLKDALDLPSLPKRMECYDISNIQGKLAVGSMVVFTNGESNKKEYRRFKIKTVTGANDVAMMQEVLRRRLGKCDQNPAKCPDLIVLDGGKAQLNAGLKIQSELDLDIPMISLAKKFEEVYLKNKSQPLLMGQGSQARRMLVKIRDEAHRFALSYHHNLRKKSAHKSALDDIEGVGPKTKKKLVQEFGSVTRIKKASLKEIQNLVGKKLGQKVKEQL
ncbi:excinuclease ABC subunit UvrC [Patescibacteria group bacterium]|nr:excinuclease ABC subunit UvrC [Patescibacteria group bacterium]